jgi:endonuclease/exonuclease/phosphatase family metal-dependent hydrolase
LTLLSWNVDNLFDTKDDSNNPSDDTYLPLTTKQQNPNHNAECAQRFSEEAEKACRGVADPQVLAHRIYECEAIDWTEEKLGKKLAAIADVIRAVQPQPDVIIMPELENEAILTTLNKVFLDSLGYSNVIEFNSTDTTCDRGIDVGVLSRLPVGEAKVHKVEFGTNAPICGATRDITQVPLTLPGGKTLHLFAVHFPSGNKAVCREHAMQKLNEVKAALPPGSMAIAGGDFNFICSDAQGDLFARMLTEGHWVAPPEVRKGCAEPGSEQFVSYRSNDEVWPTWSFLDAFLVSDNLVADATSGAGWFANLGSFRTAVVSAHQVATSPDGKVTPKDTNFKDGSGISDHWPVLIDLVPRQ